MDLGFALNYQFVYLIDTNPTGTPDWAFLGPGVESFTNDRADTTSEKAYWDKGGATSVNVTAVTSGWTVAGDRLVGDKAQDYVVGLAYRQGQRAQDQAAPRSAPTARRWSGPSRSPTSRGPGPTATRRTTCPSAAPSSARATRCSWRRPPAPSCPRP